MLDLLNPQLDAENIKKDIKLLLQKAVEPLPRGLSELNKPGEKPRYEGQILLNEKIQKAYTLLAYVIYLEDLLKDNEIELSAKDFGDGKEKELFEKLTTERKEIVNFIGDKDSPVKIEQKLVPDLIENELKFLNSQSIKDEFETVKAYMQTEFKLSFLEDRLELDDTILQSKVLADQPLVFETEVLNSTSKGYYEELEQQNENLPQRQKTRWEKVKTDYKTNFYEVERVQRANKATMGKIKESLKEPLKAGFFNRNRGLLTRKSAAITDAEDFNKINENINEIIENYAHRNPLRRFAHKLKKMLDKNFKPPETKTQKMLKEIQRGFGFTK